jgi:hypothetical protein
MPVRLNRFWMSDGAPTQGQVPACPGLGPGLRKIASLTKRFSQNMSIRTPSSTCLLALTEIDLRLLSTALLRKCYSSWCELPALGHGFPSLGTEF